MATVEAAPYLAAAVLGAILPIIASISATTSSGAACCTMCPTSGSTISFAFGTAAANGREWMLVDTVLSAPSPEITTTGARDLGVARRLFPDRFLQRDQIVRIGDEFARPQQQWRRRVPDKPVRHRLRQEHAAGAGLGQEITERQRDRVGEQRTDHRGGDDLVVPSDAARPRIGHRRQHHEAGDALRIIQRHPRAERAGP